MQMDQTIYYVLGAVAVIFILLQIATRRKAKKRKAKTFMDGYERKDRQEE